MQQRALPNPALTLVNIHSAILIYYIQGEEEEGVCVREGGEGTQRKRVSFYMSPATGAKCWLTRLQPPSEGANWKKVTFFRGRRERERERSNVEEFVVLQNTFNGINVASFKVKATVIPILPSSLLFDHSAESHNKETKILHYSFKQLRAESQQLFKLFLRVIFQDNHSQGQQCGGGATRCQGGGVPVSPNYPLLFADRTWNPAWIRLAFLNYGASPD